VKYILVFYFNNVGGKTNNLNLVFIEFSHKNALNMPLRVAIDPSWRPPPINLRALLSPSIVVRVLGTIILYIILYKNWKISTKNHEHYHHIPYSSFDETRHDGYAHSATRHDEYFDELTFSLKILRHHQRRTISGHAHSNPWNGHETNNSF